MPLKAIDYANTIIYKIVCKELAILETYVGHTTGFKDRKRQHKSKCCFEKGRDYKTKLYTFIRANGGWDNFDMIEIEKFPCNDANEAKARERYWFEHLNATLNAVCPIRTVEERKQREQNAERKEYKRQYSRTAERKEYFRKHEQTAERKEYNKQREQTAERREYKRQTFICECGCEVRKFSKSQHSKTKKHLGLTQ